MLTKNMPEAKWRRRLGAHDRLVANMKSQDRDRYATSPMGQHELRVLDERIKAYAESGQRRSRDLRV